jgi:hypothetical protein
MYTSHTNQSTQSSLSSQKTENTNSASSLEQGEETLESPCSDSGATMVYDDHFSCELCIHSLPAETTDAKRFKQLYIMYTRSTSTDISTRLKALVDHPLSKLNKSMTRPSKSCLGKEVLRRFYYLKLTCIKPRTPHWPVDRSTKV